ncbi:dicarboxylate/amino acid:cation symporter [Dethiobacter alkaliphilus]|uniref:Sodium:dicarboxylate symporter n=1 Tax=Dethiobacter alkaliphilus AHT 1 TaxID=555088 RepID=C0GIF2_DETAL|nr:dicarboxylate/amino acid:cation symporter [Dethiobacter alkaliphilus]EEG76813.1 sodium:dicarboxylate symporter [Dethiobacter alkaliphilus AHT 1]
MLRKLGLLERILIGFVLGIVAGAVFGEAIGGIKFLGDILLRLLQMLVIPLVFTTLSVGVAKIGGMKMGRIFGKTLFFYYITGIFALTIGLILANIFGVGIGMELGELGQVEVVTPPPFTETVLNIIPTNIVNAMANATMLQVVFFAIVFGISMGWAAEASAAVKATLESAAEVMFKMVYMVLAYAPIGVFALMAWTVGNFGLGVLAPFASLILVVYLGCIIHVFVVHTIFLWLFCKINPLRFIGKIKEAILFAFTTTSSAGTLPVSFKVANEVGISKSVSGFVLPIGATINMDGTALYQTAAAIFIANAFGIELTIGQMILIAVTAVLASIGTAGVPGAGLIMLMTVLGSVGLPVEGIALIAGIDRILDMARTAVNVIDDLTATAMVACTEGERLSPDLYSVKAMAE